MKNFIFVKWSGTGILILLLLLRTAAAQTIYPGTKTPLTQACTGPGSGRHSKKVALLVQEINAIPYSGSIIDKNAAYKQRYIIHYSWSSYTGKLKSESCSAKRSCRRISGKKLAKKFTPGSYYDDKRRQHRISIANYSDRYIIIRVGLENIANVTESGNETLYYYERK